MSRSAGAPCLGGTVDRLRNSILFVSCRIALCVNPQQKCLLFVGRDDERRVDTHRPTHSVACHWRSGVFVGVYVCAGAHVLVMDGLIERERDMLLLFILVMRIGAGLVHPCVPRERMTYIVPRPRHMPVRMRTHASFCPVCVKGAALKHSRFPRSANNSCVWWWQRLHPPPSNDSKGRDCRSQGSLRTVPLSSR